MFKSRLFLKAMLAVLGIIILYTLAIYVFILPKMHHVTRKLEEKNAHEVLSKVVLLAQNTHRDVTMYEALALQQHKDKLTNAVNMVISLLQAKHEASSTQNLSQEAIQNNQKEVLQLISKLRHSGDGYFYISTYNNVLVSHPYMNSMDMSNMGDMRGKAIIPDIHAIIDEYGEGFYRYFWKKNPEDSIGHEKLVFIKDFSPWEMVVMSGAYIDDIQAEIDKRKATLMLQLSEIVQKTRIGKTGYLFLFDANGTMLINPNKEIEGHTFKTIKNPATGKLIFDELIEKATTTKELIYQWNKPDDLEHYSYDKIAWIEQIPELGWYVVSSAYLEEFDTASKEIKYVTSLLALALLGFFGLYSFFVFKNLLTPAINVSKYAVMGEMIATIAHQWKQPLNELGLVLQKFEFAYHKNLLTHELLEKETKAARTLIAKMADTIDIFKNFFSLKNNTHTFDVVTSIEHMIRLMEKTLKLDDIVMIHQMQSTHTLESYQGEFEHVILNILMNAKDVLNDQKNGEKIILIKTHQSDKAFSITIQDNGGGVPEKIIHRIFNPHFSTKKEGAGIGLYIAKQIIHEHIGGKLTVENRYFHFEQEEYFGACFTIVCTI
ncbi:sensor histidine kinase [Sulfurospirillum barnesii]|uniref:histidine kinase n=1 Tax=Sulfurospirillum barnesii (strain ATCC 700032 / DSM 10660 / SES-3) TaxID=760154 RepID=I3XVS3_SULBS|nr:cache domain-containing protein [Sulfurospirillum barnesii]AFL68047.1 histidine kinase,cache domain-containing protein [Sulfurospirillum barnesii SES-3]